MEIDIAGPSITDLEIETVRDMMMNGWYNYDYVEIFEKKFAEYHDRKFGLLSPNCTSSIHLFLLALNIKEGDEVIVPECTWTATAAPITYCRAKPIFCDIDYDTWCLNPQSLKNSITDKTKAIIAVDLYGNMPRMDKLQEIANHHEIPLLEDAAEAVGSKYKGIRAGKFGLGSVFSFHRTKTITMGEGGILLTDNREIYEKAHFLRDHGRHPERHFFTMEPAYKYMPSNLQASVGYAQFQRMEELVKAKRDILETYKQILSVLPGLYFNNETEEVYNGAWLSILVIGKRYEITKKQIILELESRGLPSRPFFYPLSSLPAYKTYKTGNKNKNPVSYDISNRGIALPSALNINKEKIKIYAEMLKNILEHHLK